MNDNNPISIILVTSGSRGQRLLFRYPYTLNSDPHPQPSPHKKVVIPEDSISTAINPYELIKPNNDIDSPSPQNFIQNGELYGIHDPLLATILAPKLTLCDHNFELKIEQIMFVGHPVLVTHDDDSGFEDCLATDESGLTEDVMIKMVHVVLAVHCKTDVRIIAHYQNICRMLGKALRHEEKRYFGTLP